MRKPAGKRISVSLSLALMLVLLGSALYGCGGGSGSGSNSSGSSGQGSGSAGTTTGGSPASLSGHKGNVTVVNTLSSASRAVRRARASASVGPEAVQFVYTGFDSAGHQLFGPQTEGRRMRQPLKDLPVEVVRIHIDYRNVAQQTVATADIQVRIVAGGTVIVKATAADSFTVQIVNDSGVPDNQVYVLAAANPPASGGTQAISGVALVNTSANTFTPANGEQPGHGTQLTNLPLVGAVPSKTRPNMFDSVYAFTIQNLVSGRVYMTYNDNQLFAYNQTFGQFEAPNADANFRWDVMELTVPASTPFPLCYADLTSIQFLGIPLQLQAYADADGQQGIAQVATNSPQAGSNVPLNINNLDGLVQGSIVSVGDATKSELATVSSVTSGGIVVATLAHSYVTPYVTLTGDSALQTRTFYASTPTILNTLWGLTSTGDNRMQWAFQSQGSAAAPPPAVSPTPLPSCTPGSSPSPTPTPSPGPNVSVRGYQASNAWLQPANVGQPGSFLRVQGPQTTVAEPWSPAPSPNPALIVGGDPNSYATQRPYRAYPYPTFAGYVATMVGSCYNFAGANSCGGTATQWSYGGTVSVLGSAYLMTLNPLSAMTPDATLGCGAGGSGVPLPTNLPVSVTMKPNDTRNQTGDLDFIVYSTPGGVYKMSLPCDLVADLDNSVYADIADDALAGLQFGYVNGVSSPNDGTVWFSGFPSFPPFGAARSTTPMLNDGLYNPYAAVIYNFSDSYGFPYSDRIAQFNPLVTTTNAGSTAASTLRVTVLNDLRPDAPTGLTLSSSSDGQTVNASWNAGVYSANQPVNATSYSITISDGCPSVPPPPSADQQTRTLTTTQCSFTGLRTGTTYVAYVTATYPGGATSTHSALANVLTAGTPAFVLGGNVAPPIGTTTSGTTAGFAITVACNSADASSFTLNIPGQSIALNQATPVSIPIQGVVGTNFIPFTVTTSLTTYPSVVPPVAGTVGTVVDSGAFVVTLDAASSTTFNVNTVYMTDGSPVVIPLNPGGQTTNFGPYPNSGGLVLSATLAPGSAGSGGALNNVVKVVRPIFYATSTPSAPPVPYTCPSTGYVVPSPSATPCPPMEFTPSSGPPGSQVQITMYVNGNLNQNPVLFNGVPGALVSQSPMPAPDQRTLIVATVPYNPSAGGLVEVDTDQGKTVSLTPFTLVAPTFTISPANANVGDTVTLTAQGGFNFQSAATATSGQTNVNYTQACNAATDTSPTITATTITTTVPAGVEPGVNAISVLFPGGLTATSSGTFTVLSPKFNVVPSSGFIGSTVKLVPLQGSNLTDLTKVAFAGSTQNPPATNNNDGSYSVTVPSDATTGYITVTDGNLVTGTSSTPFTVTLPVINVTSPSPAQGLVGDTVVITSQSTGGVAPKSGGTISVQFGTGATTTASVDPTNTILTTTVPQGAVSGALTVTGCAAGTLSTSPQQFTMIVPQVSITSALSGGYGATVTIASTVTGGLASGGTVSVTFGTNGPSNPATLDPTNTTATVTVPNGALSGFLYLTGASAGPLTTQNQFTVTHPTIPGLTPFNPTHGPAGTVVTITGTGFLAAMQVYFTAGAGVAPAVFQILSDTQITATVPPTASTGVVKVQDATGDGTPSTATFSVP